MTETIGLLLAFLVMMVMISRRLPLALAMLTGSALLAGTLGLGPLGTAGFLGAALVSWPALELALIVALITLLGRLLQEFSFLHDTIRSMTGLLRSTRLALVATPSIVGCLPVIGGAIISAPLVDGLGDRIELSPVLKSSVNIVFRHAWFFIFPFMPSLIIAAQLTDLTIGQLARMQFPITIVALVVGYLALFRGRPQEPPAPATATAELARTFLVKGSPLLVSLILSIAGLHIAISLGLGVLLALCLGYKHPRLSFALLWRGIDFWMVLTMPAIMTFREVVNASGVIAGVVQNLIDGGMPLLVLAFVAPLIIGFISASHSTTIGITFPLLLPLAAPDAQPALIVLMFASSYVSYVVSPLHLCQILTIQHFKVRLAPVYATYILPMSAVILASWALVWWYLP